MPLSQPFHGNNSHTSHVCGITRRRHLKGWGKQRGHGEMQSGMPECTRERRTVTSSVNTPRLVEAVAVRCTILLREGTDAGSVWSTWEWPGVAVLLLVLW